jgi:hypothetical protein
MAGCSGRGPHQHDFVCECTRGELTAENIADGNVWKGLLRAKVVNEELTAFVNGNKPFLVDHLIAGVE